MRVYIYSTMVMIFSLLLSGKARGVDMGIIDLHSNDTVETGKIFQVKLDGFRLLRDRENMEMKISSNSIAMMMDSGNLHILSGSAFLYSLKKRTIETANSIVNFKGKIIISYDKKNLITSVFAIAGKVNFRNRHYSEAKKVLHENEGAVLGIKGMEPEIQKGLTVFGLSHWLSSYQWSAQDQEILLKSLVKVIPNRYTKVRRKKEKDPLLVEKELEQFFPKEHAIYENRYTSSALRGKSQIPNEYKVLHQERISVLTPEEAAAIPLPTLAIHPNIAKVILKSEARKNNTRKYKRRKVLSKKARKLKKVKRVLTSQKEDAVITNSLKRLKALEKKNSEDTLFNYPNTRYENLLENF